VPQVSRCSKPGIGRKGGPAFGNISKTATVGTSFQATYAASTNRITLIGSLVPTYDANGNLTNDTIHAYTWDAEGKMLNVDSGTAGGACATYDALGRMVEKASGTSCTSTYTEVVYSPSGIRLATMTGQTLQQASVALLNGSEAVYNSSGLLVYRHSDHLGSSRFASTPSRTKYYDVAYAPYGEDYVSSGTADLSFTGQKKDTASWRLADALDAKGEKHFLAPSNSLYLPGEYASMNCCICGSGGPQLPCDYCYPDPPTVSLSCNEQNLSFGATAPASTVTGSCVATGSPTGGSFSWSTNKTTISLNASGSSATYTSANPK
jgi:hypothetical protein